MMCKRQKKSIFLLGQQVLDEVVNVAVKDVDRQSDGTPDFFRWFLYWASFQKGFRIGWSSVHLFGVRVCLSSDPEKEMSCGKLFT